MFKKVLIAEDHESVSISVQKTLSDLGILHDNRNYVYYCDDALSRIKTGLRENEPYELLITDLSFEEDSPGQKITDGPNLIKAVKEIQPDIKILIFSIENRVNVANSFFNELGIDAFVPKARQDAKDLKLAIEAIYGNKKYFSPNLKQTVRAENYYEFTDYDKKIISLLSNGVSQKDIPFYLQQSNMKPFGLSSVEKRLNHIKTELNIFKNEQLIAYCKDRNIV